MKHEKFTNANMPKNAENLHENDTIPMKMSTLPPQQPPSWWCRKKLPEFFLKVQIVIFLKFLYQKKCVFIFFSTTE